jgi:hypothetical protein
VTLVRTRLATVLWLVAGTAAVLLAVAALLRALDVDTQAEPARTVLDAADALSLDAVSRIAPSGASDTEALLVWGAAALLWLGIGWLLDRLVRPAASRGTM